MDRYLATVVVLVAVLSEGSASAASLPMLAVLVITPVRLGVTTIVTVRLHPRAGARAWLHLSRHGGTTALRRMTLGRGCTRARHGGTTALRRITRGRGCT